MRTRSAGGRARRQGSTLRTSPADGSSRAARTGGSRKRRSHTATVPPLLPEAARWGRPGWTATLLMRRAVPCAPSSAAVAFRRSSGAGNRRQSWNRGQRPRKRHREKPMAPEGLSAGYCHCRPCPGLRIRPICGGVAVAITHRSSGGRILEMRASSRDHQKPAGPSSYCLCGDFHWCFQALISGLTSPACWRCYFQGRFE